LDTVSNGTTQKSPEPDLWHGIFSAKWRSLAQIVSLAQQMCSGGAGDLLGHGAGRLLDLRWQGYTAVCGGVGLAGDPGSSDAALAQLADRVARLAPRLAAVS